MKRIFNKAIIASTLFATHVFSQAVEKKQLIIDAYIGGPQFFGILPSSSDANGGRLTIDKQNLGPFGLRVEYMITKRSSLGLEGNFANTDLDIAWSDGKDPYAANFTSSRTRLFPRYALHFGGKKLDAYWHVGLGFSYWSATLNVKDPSSTFKEDDVRGLNRVSGPVVAFRTGIGLRYFFTPNIGLNADFGIGGALFTIGLTGKLSTAK